MCLVTYSEAFRKCEVSEEVSWVCGKSASLESPQKKPCKMGTVRILCGCWGHVLRSYSQSRCLSCEVPRGISWLVFLRTAAVPCATNRVPLQSQAGRPQGPAWGQQAACFSGRHWRAATGTFLVAAAGGQRGGCNSSGQAGAGIADEARRCGRGRAEPEGHTLVGAGTPFAPSLLLKVGRLVSRRLGAPGVPGESEILRNDQCPSQWLRSCCSAEGPMALGDMPFWEESVLPPCVHPPPL